jgi:hypothetical protein
MTRRYAKSTRTTPISSSPTAPSRSADTGRRGSRSRPKPSTNTDAACCPATVSAIVGARADLGDQQEDGRHVDRAAEAAEPAPPGQLAQRPEPRRRGLGKRQGGGEQHGHPGRGHHERDRRRRDRRVEVGAELGIDRSLDREGRPGGQRQREPASPCGSKGAASRLRPRDESGAGDHCGGARDLRPAWRLPLDAEPAEPVERERGEHLPGDPQGNRHHCAEPREQQDPRGDVEGARESADEVPGLDVVHQTERAQRANRRARREQEQGADAELERRRAEWAAGRRAQLHVGGGLERQQAADAEQERNRKNVHRTSPLT